MDAQDVQRLLREDAARFRQVVDEVDLEGFTTAVLDRLGLSRGPEDRTGEQSRRR